MLGRPIAAAVLGRIEINSMIFEPFAQWFVDTGSPQRELSNLHLQCSLGDSRRLTPVRAMCAM